VVFQVYRFHRARGHLPVRALFPIFLQLTLRSAPIALALLMRCPGWTALPTTPWSWFAASASQPTSTQTASQPHRHALTNLSTPHLNPFVRRCFIPPKMEPRCPCLSHTARALFWTAPTQPCCMAMVRLCVSVCCNVPMLYVLMLYVLMLYTHPCVAVMHTTALGGFNISLTPSFSVSRLCWMLAYDGVYVIASLRCASFSTVRAFDSIVNASNNRGGGEYGLAWRDAGSVHHKQNMFDDFQSAAEHLHAQGYSSPETLVIEVRWRKYMEKLHGLIQHIYSINAFNQPGRLQWRSAGGCQCQSAP